MYSKLKDWIPASAGMTVPLLADIRNLMHFLKNVGYHLASLRD